MIPALLILILIVSSIGGELTLLRYASDLYCVNSGEELLRESPALAWNYPLESGYKNESIQWIPPAVDEFNELSIQRHTLSSAHANLPRNLQDLAVKDRRWNDFKLHAIPRGKEECIFPGTLYSTMEMAISMLVECNVNIHLYSDLSEANDNSNSKYKYFKLYIHCDKKGTTIQELHWCEKPCIDPSNSNCEKLAKCKMIQPELKTGSLLSQSKSWTTLQLMYTEEKYNGSIFTVRSDTSFDSWRAHQKLQRVGRLCILHRSKYNIGLFRLHDYNVLKPPPTTRNFEYAEFTPQHDAELCIEIIYYYVSRHPGTLQLLKGRNNVEESVNFDSMKDGWKLLRHVFSLKGGTNYLVMIVADNYDLIIGDVRICNENEIRVAKLYGETVASCTNLKNNESIAMSNITSRGSRAYDEFVFNCPVGYFGVNCNLLCSAVLPNAQDCSGVVACRAASGCSCLTGFTGKNCDSSCSEFTYGPRCESCGNCKNNLSCNILNGNCPEGCAEGWMGKKCDIECSEGTFGEGCTSRCANCKGGPEECNKVTGHCSQGCEDGYLDITCNTPCTSGRYGENCELECSGHCKDGDTCDHVTGKCEFGCEDGWTGVNCNEPCSFGTYGSGCNLKCGHCRNETVCDPVDGTCPDEDCDNGWIGKTCQTACIRGQYGYRCEMLCRGNCKDDVSCNFMTGVCDDGCAIGYQGDKCTERVDIITASLASFFGVIFIVSILAFVFWKLYCKYKRKVCMNSVQYRNSRPRTLGAENESADSHHHSIIYDVIEGGSVGTPQPPTTPDVPSRHNAFEYNRASYDDVNLAPKLGPRISSGVDNVTFSRRSGETSIGTPDVPTETPIYSNASAVELINEVEEESARSSGNESADVEDSYISVLPSNIEENKPDLERKAISDENLNAHNPSDDQVNLRDIKSIESIFYEARDSLEESTTNAIRRMSLDEVQIRGTQICRPDTTNSTPFPK